MIRTFTPGALEAAARAKAVFFDFDGTLANTVDGIRETAREALAEFGMDEEAIGDTNRIIGPAFPGAFSEVYGVTAEEAVEITALYRKIYASRGPEAWEPYPGIAELLGALVEEGKTLAVTTCKLADLTVSMAADHGILEPFACVVGKPDDSPVTKSVLVARTLARLGVAPQDAVMVGDRHNDMEGARDQGVLAVGVAYGAGTAAELEAAGADVTVDSVEELGRVLLGAVPGM